MDRAKCIVVSIIALTLLTENAIARQKSSAFERWGVTQSIKKDEAVDNLLEKAYSLFYDNEFEKAKAYYSLVLDINPDCAEAQIGLSFAYRYLGDDAQSFQAIKKALELDSLASSAHWNYGELLWPWRGVYGLCCKYDAISY